MPNSIGTSAPVSVRWTPSAASAREVSTARIDYAALVDPSTLEDADAITPGLVAALAVRIGNTRLIDNMILNPTDKGDTTP